MKKVAITYVGKDNNAVLQELLALPAGTILDITRANGDIDEDIDSEDEIELLGGTGRVVIKDPIKGNKGALTIVPAATAPKVEEVECIITSVSGIITRPANNTKGETSFKLVEYITRDGINGRIIVNTSFLGANEGQNDLLIQRDAALKLTIEHTIKDVTQYVETREANVNYNKLMFHPTTGPALRNVVGLSTKQAEILTKQFEVAERTILASATANEKVAMAGAQVIQLEKFGEALAKWANNPVMFEKMSKLYEIAAAK